MDDNGVAAFEDHIQQVFTIVSVMSAFEVFGLDYCRGHCLQALKWTPDVSELFMFLGFLIDAHSMTVSWPFAKRKALDELFFSIMARRPWFVSPKEMARVVGIVHSARLKFRHGVIFSVSICRIP